MLADFLPSAVFIADGVAISLWQADQRSTALREVDRAARRAMSAATARADGGA